MKEIRLLIFPVVLFMTFMSCIKEDELLPDYTPVEVVFSVGATRATDATWTNGDAVGVYVLPAGGNVLSTAKESNRKYTVDANGAMTLSDGGATIYYPIDDTGLRFMTYYPYGPVTTDYKMTFGFADQSTQANKEAVDFCFHRGTTNYSRTNPATSLVFSHKFSKILMTVRKGANGPDVKNVTVRLSNMPDSATVDLNRYAMLQADSIVVGTEAATITAYTNSAAGTNDYVTVEAIVPPHSGKAGRVLTFTTSDRARTYELDSSLAFEAGKVYTFDVTLMDFTPVVGSGDANCFITPPFASLTFPMTRAYSSGNTLQVGGTYAGDFAAIVIWADAVVLNGTPTVSGSGREAVVNVKTTGNVGNAVVKIYKSTDTSAKTAVWSYHIWVVDYDGTATHTNNGFTFMDRNLGATKASLGYGLGTGLFYQWGRKDPFPATIPPGTGDESTQPGGGRFNVTATSATNGTVVNTIKNPGVFYYNTSDPYDWHYASRNNTLWGHNSTKTIYDPCPAGWRVPSNSNMSNATSPWYGFTASNGGTFSSGWNWGTNALYPAAGFRVGNTVGASIFSTNGAGFYYTASPYSSSSGRASLMYFNNLSVEVSVNSSTFGRAFGMSVRCVQE